MAYFLFKSSNNITPFAIINETTQDVTSSSIAFVGKRRVDYGESQQQNQLWQLENFANVTPPSNPIVGQLWYDTGVAEMKVYNGSQFVRIANVYADVVPPLNPTLGKFWFKRDTGELFIWNGTTWWFIGPAEDPIPYAIVFGG